MDLRSGSSHDIDLFCEGCMDFMEYDADEFLKGDPDESKDMAKR